MESYDYFLTFQAITIDSRLVWRARLRDGGFYWKTWDVFTGQVEQSQTLEEAYQNGEIDGDATLTRVRELYPPSSELRALQEQDRQPFLEAMVEIKRGMVRGVDKNLYVEPIIWTIEYAQSKYEYPQTRSN